MYYVMKQLLTLTILALCYLSCSTKTETKTIKDRSQLFVPDTTNNKLTEILTYMDFCNRITALARKHNAIVPYNYELTHHTTFTFSQEELGIISSIIPTGRQVHPVAVRSALHNLFHHFILPSALNQPASS